MPDIRSFYVRCCGVRGNSSKAETNRKKATAMGKAYVVCQIKFLTETHREAREFIENEYDLVRRLVFSLSMRASSVSCFSFICVCHECVKFVHAMSVYWAFDQAMKKSCSHSFNYQFFFFNFNRL